MQNSWQIISKQYSVDKFKGLHSESIQLLLFSTGCQEGFFAAIC